MANTLSLYMNVLTRNLTMLFGSLIFMFSLSWRLTIVTFIAVPIIFLVSKVYGVYYDVSFFLNGTNPAYKSAFDYIFLFQKEYSLNLDLFNSFCGTTIAYCKTD